MIELFVEIVPSLMLDRALVTPLETIRLIQGNKDTCVEDENFRSCTVLHRLYSSYVNININLLIRTYSLLTYSR